ncbi:bifunctional hydroxymethylpyrimidine kinase/phosphomethylpyrimidine kinase [Thermodesulfobacteriota bacterium]
MSMPKAYHKVLTIAGSDCGGGAGIQADLKTIAALGCYGLSVITALTAQNTRGIQAVQGVSPAFVAEQLEAVFSDMEPDAIKIGMLYSRENIEVVAGKLKSFSARNIVLDPVMVAGSGEPLLQADALDSLKAHLIPLATLFTPNLPETSIILQREVQGLEEMEQAARDLSSFGSRSVLIKGGHADPVDSNDLLYIGKEDRSVILRGERVATKNQHGTGCTHSSAIACCLARGLALEAAAREAKVYVSEALQAGSGYRLGRGTGPLHHHYRFW